MFSLREPEQKLNGEPQAKCKHLLYYTVLQDLKFI